MGAAVVGGALAAVGQARLVDPPSLADGSALQRLGVAGWFASESDDILPDSRQAAVGTGIAAGVAGAPTLPVPRTVDVDDLMRASGLDRPSEQVARATAQARAVVTDRDAEATSRPRVQPAQTLSPGRSLANGGGVQMMVGRITSGFGPRWDARHKGLDIAAPIGTPIRVPLDGVVLNSGPASGFGLWVRVRHDDGTITVYGHINRTLVEVGQRVRAGEVIAQVGNRGQSTGPHLHFEVITGAGNINPTPWLAQRGVGVT